MHDEDTRTATATPPALAAASAGMMLLIGGVLALDPVLAASDGAGAAGLVPAFDTLDTDADGTLSEKEWRASDAASTMSDDIAAAHYSMYDVDRNGSVSAEEYERVNEEVLKGRGGTSI